MNTDKGIWKSLKNNPPEKGQKIIRFFRKRDRIKSVHVTVDVYNDQFIVTDEYLLTECPIEDKTCTKN